MIIDNLIENMIKKMSKPWKLCKWANHMGQLCILWHSLTWVSTLPCTNKILNVQDTRWGPWETGRHRKIGNLNPKLKVPKSKTEMKGLEMRQRGAALLGTCDRSRTAINSGVYPNFENLITSLNESRPFYLRCCKLNTVLQITICRDIVADLGISDI